MRKQLEQLEEEFHKAFGLYMNEHPALRIPQELHELRMRVMKEEVDESEEYAITGDSEDKRLQAVAKELADIAYTLLGTIASLIRCLVRLSLTDCRTSLSVSSMRYTKVI